MSDKKIGLRDLLKSKGLLFPSNSDEVIEFEKLNDIEQEDPKDFDNPINVILKGKQDIQNLKRVIISQTEIQNLAMAAREGKVISDEIRRKMDEDRNNAKKK